MSLPPALQPLATYNKFITFTTKPSTRAGKLDKIPTDHRSGQVANAQDPAIWADYDTCYAKGNGQVGYVFTDDDPFWFLDIDNCLMPDNKWSPLAQELVQLLAGAAVEVSISGKGLHIFGTGVIPKHTCRNAALGLELYHTGRFVALGTLAQGNALHDCTASLAIVIDRYFKRGEAEDLPQAEWTSAPCEGWKGPTDDADLIRRACAVKSSASVFGSKASFLQLWDADIAALSVAFPDSGGRAYNASGADAALVQHLAFWTGKDCARMERLLRMSALARPKYDEHDSYVSRTISQAVAKQGDVCKDKDAELPKPMQVGVRDVEGSLLMDVAAQKILFANHVYVTSENKIYMPNNYAVSKEVFDSLLQTYDFVLDMANSKVCKSASDAFLGSKMIVWPRVRYAQFRPDLAPGEIFTEGNHQCVNTYWPINIKSVKGNPRPFIDHVARILPDPHDQEIILAYMAAVVQYPGVKFQWCPLIQGAEGNGKSLLSRCMEYAIGEEHTHWPKASELGEKFNKWMEGKIFIAIEDIFVTKEKREMMEILKPMITSNKQEIRSMGVDKITKRICCNFIMNSNHKDAIQKTKNDRRFAVFYCAQQEKEDLLLQGMDEGYFTRLYAWLNREGYAVVSDYLRNYKIPDELNPTKTCQRAPITSSTTEAIGHSMGTLEQEINEAILSDKVGFRDGWISTHFLDVLIRECGGLRVARNKRTEILANMGYVVHPGLPNGQVFNPVLPDGCKPRLFITKDHTSLLLHGVAITKAYSEAQSDTNVVRLVM